MAAYTIGVTAIIALLSGASGAFGQSTDGSLRPERPRFVAIDSSIGEGAIFEPFDFWQQVRLGATSLMNPWLAQNTAVLFAYSPDSLSYYGGTSEPFSFVFAKEVSSGNYQVASAAEQQRLSEVISQGQDIGLGWRAFAFEELAYADSVAKMIMWPAPPTSNSRATRDHFLVPY